jgi:hypothetical protein
MKNWVLSALPMIVSLQGLYANTSLKGHDVVNVWAFWSIQPMTTPLGVGTVMKHWRMVLMFGELFVKHAVTVCALCFNTIRFRCEEVH